METSLIYALIASFSVMLVSLVGIVFVWNKLGAFISRNLSYFVSFSAGVFAVVVFYLIRETFELSLNFSVSIISIVLGIFVVSMAEVLLPETHHHHGRDCEGHHGKNEAKRIMFGDAIHNVGDGILLAPAFVISIELGVLATLGILFHEFVQEISEFFVLRRSGYSTKSALKLNFLISGTIIPGIIIGFFLSSVSFLAGPLIGFAAGVFLYVVVVDLIPNTFRETLRTKTYVSHFTAAVVGVLLMIGINNVAISYDAPTEQSPDSAINEILVIESFNGAT